MPVSRPAAQGQVAVLEPETPAMPAVGWEAAPALDAVVVEKEVRCGLRSRAI